MSSILVPSGRRTYNEPPWVSYEQWAKIQARSAADAEWDTYGRGSFQQVPPRPLTHTPHIDLHVPLLTTTTPEHTPHTPRTPNCGHGLCFIVRAPASPAGVRGRGRIVNGEAGRGLRGHRDDGAALYPAYSQGSSRWRAGPAPRDDGPPDQPSAEPRGEREAPSSLYCTDKPATRHLPRHELTGSPRCPPPRSQGGGVPAALWVLCNHSR